MITFPPTHTYEDIKADVLEAMAGAEPGKYLTDDGMVTITKLSDAYKVHLLLPYRSWTFFFSIPVFEGKAVTA